jgi:hypothetical protein
LDDAFSRVIQPLTIRQQRKQFYGDEKLLSHLLAFLQEKLGGVLYFEIIF